MNGLKHGLSSEFVPEWCAVAALILLDVLWAARIPVTFTITRDEFLVLGLGLGACWGLRAMRLRKGGLMAEYFALTLTATTAICVLSYLCLAAAGPLVDARLMAMDRKQRMRDMFWLFGLCALFACLGTLLFPALGPSKFFNIETHNGFVPVMEHILSGRDLTFALSGMTGVVSFPSFHTAMALAYVWAFRGTGPAGWAMAGVNLVMLLAVPFFGGHYLMDMIAGAATMLLSLAMVKYAPGLWAMRGTGQRQTVAAANA